MDPEAGFASIFDALYADARSLNAQWPFSKTPSPAAAAGSSTPAAAQVGI